MFQCADCYLCFPFLFFCRYLEVLFKAYGNLIYKNPKITISCLTGTLTTMALVTPLFAPLLQP